MSNHSKDKKEAKEDKEVKKSIVDWLYVKLLKDPSTNVIIVVVSFVFIVWMVIPLLLVLSSGVYFNGHWSVKPIENVFTDDLFFNWKGDNATSFYERSETEHGGPAVNLAYANGILYVAERSDGIEVLNTSDPYNIVEITQYDDLESSIGDLAINGSTLFAGAGKTGLLVLDVSNPEEGIHVISSYSVSTNYTHFIELSDDLVVLDNNGKGFFLFDVSNIEDPVPLASEIVETDVYDAAIWEDYLFIVGYTTGLLVYNISDPTNPEVVANYRSIPEINDLYSYDISIRDGLAYIATSKYDGLVILNVTNPLDVTYLSKIQSVSATRVLLEGNYAYCVVQDDLNFEYGIKIVDITDPYNMVEAGSKIYIGIRTENFAFDPERNIGFLAQLGEGTYVVDMQDYSNIEQTDSYVDTITITTHTLSGKSFGVVLNTIILGIATTFFSVVFGTSLAFILARYEFPGKRIASLLALAPLIIPPFISGMGFRLLLGPSGFLNNLFLIPLFRTQVIFQGFVAICFVQTFHFYALVYLNAFSSFLNIDPSLEEQAENLGASSFQLFFHVTLPLALPGIGAGAILVLILAMEDVGTPIIFANMGDNRAKEYLTYYVFSNFQKAGSATITPEVCVLGGILLIIALVGFFAIRKYVSLRQYAMISKGRAGSYRMSKAGLRLFFIYPYLIILFTLSLLVHVGIFLMSIMETLGVTDAHQINFTFENYKLIFVSSKYNIPPYIKNTLVYSVSATILIIIIGSLAAYVVSRKDFKGKNLFDAMVTLPLAIPGIVLAIGFYREFDWGSIVARNPTPFNKFMMNMFVKLKLDPFLTTAITLLILSYTVRKIPFTVRSVFAGLQQTDVVLEEASFNLGAGRVKTFSRITLPLISLNIFAGGLVSFLYCLSEVSTTLFLIFEDRAGTITWMMAYHTVKFQIFCALGVILMVLQILSLFITNVILGSRAEAITGI